MSIDEVIDGLAAPFESSEIKWKPQMVKQNRCLAIAYIDARLVMDRLDDVLGPDLWQDAYEVLGDGSVICTLKVSFADGEWVTKQDVGSLSEQPDAGDRLKSAFSDALKRAAVKFGIGRYLYRLPAQWVDYDPNTKRITQVPHLPDWAIPGKQANRDRAAPQSANGQPAKVNTASTEAVHRPTLEKFTAMLAAGPSVEVLNASLKDMNGLDKYTWRAIWREIQTYAGVNGMDWDEGNKRFVAPVETTQADDFIPF